jgi:hypothetical protein
VRAPAGIYVPAVRLADDGSGALVPLAQWHREP